MIMSLFSYNSVYYSDARANCSFNVIEFIVTS